MPNIPIVNWREGVLEYNGCSISVKQVGSYRPSTPKATMQVPLVYSGYGAFEVISSEESLPTGVGPFIIKIGSDSIQVLSIEPDGATNRYRAFLD